MTTAAAEFTGTGALTGFVIRRDWLRILVWTGAIAVLVVVSAQSVKSLYPTPADLVSAARASEGNAAAMATVAAMNIALGALVTVSLHALDLPRTGSVAFGLSFALVGFFFACVTLVAAQVSENTRVVYGIAGTAVAAAFVLRALGDIGDGTLSWRSPIGWAQKTRPWPRTRRPPFRTGACRGQPRTAGRPRHASATRKHRRLERGVLLTGVAYGAITDSINDFVEDNQSIADLVAAQGGGSLLESYLAMSIQVRALLGAGFAIQSVLPLRSEETTMHAEQILAATVIGDIDLLMRSLGAALVHAPAVWVLIGVSVALFGFAPRAAATSWAALTG